MSTENIFTTGVFEEAPSNTLSKLYDKTLLQLASTPANGAASRVVFGLESASPEDLNVGKRYITSTYETLHQHVEDVQQASLESALYHGNEDVPAQESDYSELQLKAAAIATAMTYDLTSSFRHEPTALPTTSENKISLESSNVAVGAYKTRPNEYVSLEAYNETETRVAEAYTIQYNLHAPAQSALSRALFQPVLLSPNSVGYEVTAPVSFIKDDALHGIKGELFDDNRRNLLRAGSDMNLLKSNVTEMVPVVRDTTKQFFAPPEVYEPKLKDITNQEPVLTSFLKPRQRINYISLCTTDYSLTEGRPDSTDDVDPASLKLDRLLCVIGDDRVVFNLTDLPYSNFTYTTQGESRELAVSFESSGLVIDSDTRTIAGPLTTLGAVVANDLTIELTVLVDGRFNVEKGDHMVSNILVELDDVRDSEGLSLPKDSASFQAIKTLFDEIETYYTIHAKRTLANRSLRGRLLGSTEYSIINHVPHCEPLTVLRPTGTDESTDTSDLETIIQGTLTEAAGSAARALLDRSDLLDRTKNSPSHQGANPRVFGISDLLVNRAYIRETYDLNDIVNSSSSAVLVKDTREAMINIIRETLLELVATSEIGYVASMLNSGAPVKIKPIIVTSHHLSQHLQVAGTAQTFGPQFAEPEIIDMLYPEFKDRVIICLDVDVDTKGLNPLKPGDFAYAPEVTHILPIKRNGRTSRELCVIPRHRHVMNTVIMGDLTIKNITSTMVTKTIRYSTDPTTETETTPTP